MKKFVAIRNDALFLIVGDGPLLDRLKKKVNEYNLSNNVRFMGRFEETQKIYSISDITINCSIKEGLALTSYESLSMNVPVISSDVGGQKELINSKVGEIVPCLQEEKDAEIFKYTDEEINLYVEALKKVSSNLESYSKNCRKRVLNGFTINQMIKNMNDILVDIHDNPNKEKIKNGENLSSSIDITKELITKEYIQIAEKYACLCQNYNKSYGYNEFSDFELLKIKMWEHRWYRGIVKITKKIGIFNIVKKVLKK